MQVDVIYALPLRHPLDEMEQTWPQDVLDRVIDYGGGNTDPVAFLGIKLATLAEGYVVTHLAWADLATLTTQHQGACQAFDRWWATYAATLRAECQASDPALLFVFDSD